VVLVVQLVQLSDLQAVRHSQDSLQIFFAVQPFIRVALAVPVVRVVAAMELLVAEAEAVAAVVGLYILQPILLKPMVRL
jgi:hypothetical protein